MDVASKSCCPSDGLPLPLAYLVSYDTTAQRHTSRGGFGLSAASSTKIVFFFTPYIDDDDEHRVAYVRASYAASAARHRARSTSRNRAIVASGGDVRYHGGVQVEKGVRPTERQQQSETTRATDVVNSDVRWRCRTAYCPTGGNTRAGESNRIEGAEFDEGAKMRAGQTDAKGPAV
ncbi:hypothetical protein BDW22DRAFT_1342590 [Trametopsis cervina]|nr:hypothetical protein BDW22DRAFT_1342590 [Trametopsis cervina]